MARYHVPPPEALGGDGQAIPARDAAASESRKAHLQVHRLMAVLLCVLHFGAIVYGLSRGGPYILWTLFGIVMVSVIAISFVATGKREKKKKP